MSEADDIEEFMETAVAGAVLGKARAARDLDDDNETVNTGQASQYAINGPGYVPTTKTIQTLPPGVYGISMVNDVTTFIPKRIVTDKLLRLPDSRSDQVVREIERFWQLKDKFSRFGFTHKRGFLLYGPPGSGKTCTVAVVTEQMVVEGDIVVLGDCGPSMLSMMLARFRTVEPERRVVVVLEDIDTIIADHGETDVLSLLDGEASIDNVVFIATTNYPEHLDGRVVNRPSRFDKIVKIGFPSAPARKIYLQSRELGLSDLELDRWVRETDGFSLAHIKELVVGVMCFGDDVEQVVKRLHSMAKTPKSKGEGTVGFGARNNEEE